MTTDDTAVTFDPRSNDSDSDGNALTITAVGSPSHGTVVNNSGTSVTYTPTTDYYGSDSFTYTISDGHGGTATATVAVTVNHVNQPPVAATSVYRLRINPNRHTFTSTQPTSVRSPTAPTQMEIL